MTHCREVAENVSVVLKSNVIVSTTMVYPTRACPARGIFVQHRLAAMHAILPVAVVSPQPWFPILRPMDDFDSANELIPLVVRPRMFYLPGFMKGMDAGFYANAFRLGLREVERTHEVMGIDAHFEWPDAVGAWIVARERGLPFVCTLRGKLVSQSKDRRKRRWITRMLSDADGVISVSHSLAELARRLVGRPIEIRVIPNGVDSDVFVRRDTRGNSENGIHPSARDLLEWDRNAKYVVSVGHALKLKGFHRLVEVWPEVCRSAGDVRLMLVGGEAHEPGYVRALRKMICAANADIGARHGRDAIEWIGAFSQNRIAMMLNSADLFALASSSEGWCNAMAESLACGCPVVATDVGGNREVLGGEQNGLLTPLGDSAALCSAIVEGLQRDWNRAAIAEFGQSRTWANAGRDSVSAFKSACVRHAGRARRSA